MMNYDEMYATLKAMRKATEQLEITIKSMQKEYCRQSGPFCECSYAQCGEGCIPEDHYNDDLEDDIPDDAFEDIPKKCRECMVTPWDRWEGLKACSECGSTEEEEAMK